MSSDELDFRKLSFKSPEAVDRRWLEWFREEFGRRMFRVDIEPAADVPFWLDNTIRVLPDLAVYSGSGSPTRSAHPKELIADDDVLLLAVQEGAVFAQWDGKEAAVKPGMAAVGRSDIASLLHFRSPTKVVALRLSRRLLDPFVPGLADAVGVVPAEPQALRLLLGYLRTLDAEPSLPTPELRQLVTHHIRDLVAAMIGASRDAGAAAEAGGVRAARLAAVKADIIANLTRPDLSAAIVAARQGLTPRYVHLLFEPEGVTFSDFVIGQRLALAYRMLTDPRYARHAVSAIALMVGFGDLSYFNRTFRQRFGDTPTGVRSRARGGSA